MSRKPLSCMFVDDVLCSYVKHEKSFGVLDRCFKCSHYERFLREMDAEDEKVMDEIEEIQELRERCLRGEATEAELRRRFFKGMRE